MHGTYIIYEVYRSGEGGEDCAWFCSILGSLSYSTWHAPRNRSKPRKLEPRRRLLQRCDPPFPRQGHRSSRSTRSDGRKHRVDPSRAPKKKTGPSQSPFFIPLCLPYHTSTDQVTISPGSSIVVSPSLLLAWGFGASPATRDISKAIASQPVPTEIICRWSQRPGEDASRR